MSASFLSRIASSDPSCVLLSMDECTGCSQHMRGKPFGIVSVISKVSSPPVYHEDSDDYVDADTEYPFFHLVCQTCYERLANKTPGTLEFFQENKPEWSALELVFGPEDDFKRMYEMTNEKEILQMISEVSHSSIWYAHLNNLHCSMNDGRDLHYIEDMAMKLFPEY